MPNSDPDMLVIFLRSEHFIQNIWRGHMLTRTQSITSLNHLVILWLIPKVFIGIIQPDSSCQWYPDMNGLTACKLTHLECIRKLNRKHIKRYWLLRKNSKNSKWEYLEISKTFSVLPHLKGLDSLSIYTSCEFDMCYLRENHRAEPKFIKSVHSLIKQSSGWWCQEEGMHSHHLGSHQGHQLWTTSTAITVSYTAGIKDSIMWACWERPGR